jgi:hypothetical protein
MKRLRSDQPSREQVAAQIERLFNDTQLILSNPIATTYKMQRLCGQIRALRKETAELGLCEMDSWLQRIQRQVEVYWPAARHTTRT